MKWRQKRPVGRQRIRPEESAEQSVRLAPQPRQRANVAELGRAQREAVVRTGQKLGKFWLQRFGLYILLFAALFSAVNMLTLTANVKVLPLAGVQNKTLLRNTLDYESAANKWLQGSVWNRNKITADINGLQDYMRRQFPELTDVRVTMPIVAHRPLVYLQPAEPALILLGRNGAFLIDTNGKALLTAATPEELDQPALPLVHDQSGLHLTKNQTILPTHQVSFIRTVVAQLSLKQLTIAALTLPAGASELDVQLKDQPYIIKFNLQTKTPREQVGTYLATLAYLQKQNQTASKYVDVRLAGRAYYQ